MTIFIQLPKLIYSASKRFSNYRYTLDYKKDLKLIKNIINNFKDHTQLNLKI